MVHFLTVTFFGDFLTGFLTTGFLVTAGLRVVVTTGVDTVRSTPATALATSGVVVVVVVCSTVVAGAGALSATGVGSSDDAGSLTGSLTGSGAWVVVITAVVVVVGATPSIVPSHDTAQSPFVTTGLLLAPIN